jgi:hypothetical protein
MQHKSIYSYSSGHSIQVFTDVVQSLNMAVDELLQTLGSNGCSASDSDLRRITLLSKHANRVTGAVRRLIRKNCTPDSEATSACHLSTSRPVSSMSSSLV